MVVSGEAVSSLDVLPAANLAAFGTLKRHLVQQGLLLRLVEGLVLVLVY